MADAAPTNAPPPRPIIIRRVKKVVGGGHHGGAWKVAYADFVTAMMAFFLLLWLISNPDKERLKGLAEFFSPAPPRPASATGATTGPTTTSLAGGHTMRQASDARDGGGQPALLATSPGVARGGRAEVPDGPLRVSAEELKLALDAMPDAERPATSLEQVGDTIRISITDNDRLAMFRSGQAELAPWGRTILTRAAAPLSRAAVLVALEGHSDGDGRASEANLALSAQRAQAARRYLAAAGVAAARLGGVSGMADLQPIYPDQPGRAENRRIVLVLSSPGAALPDDADFAF